MYIFRDVSCQTPCKRNVEASCRPQDFTTANFTAPCVPTQWTTYADTPNPLRGLEKCYEHFEEPESGNERFSWILIAIQAGAGVIVFGICAGRKLLRGNQLSSHNGSGVSPTNAAEVPAISDPRYPDDTNFGPSFPNDPGFAATIQQPGLWGATQTSSVYQQQPGFSATLSPTTVPGPPSYEESFQYGNSSYQ